MLLFRWTSPLWLSSNLHLYLFILTKKHKIVLWLKNLAVSGNSCSLIRLLIFYPTCQTHLHLMHSLSFQFSSFRVSLYMVINVGQFNLQNCHLTKHNCLIISWSQAGGFLFSPYCAISCNISRSKEDSAWKSCHNVTGEAHHHKSRKEKITAMHLGVPLAVFSECFLGLRGGKVNVTDLN